MARHHNVAVIGVDAAHGIAMARIVDDSMEPEFGAGDVVVGDSSGCAPGGVLLLWDTGEATFVEELAPDEDGASFKFHNPAYTGFHLSHARMETNCPLNFGVVVHLVCIDGQWVCKSALKPSHL